MQKPSPDNEVIDVSCKALLYTVNSSASTVAANGTVPLGTVTRRFGQSIRQNVNNITLAGSGYYLVSLNMTASPSAAGAITVTLNENGAAVAGGAATVTTTAESEQTQITLAQIPVRVLCCNGIKSLSVTLSV